MFLLYDRGDVCAHAATATACESGGAPRTAAAALRRGLRGRRCANDSESLHARAQPTNISADLLLVHYPIDLLQNATPYK